MSRSIPAPTDSGPFWHFAYARVIGEPFPQPYPCQCIEEHHADLMQWVGQYPDDYRPAPRELQAGPR